MSQMQIFAGRKAETLSALEEVMTKLSLKAGEQIFRHGENKAELYLIRRGKVRILLPLNQHREHHIATFGRGQFFGEPAFLDPAPRTADAVALTDVELFALTREDFDRVTAVHHMLATTMLEALADIIARRLRTTNAELELLQEN